ncbi:MAG: MgtC/SapB family protein [Myxococcaceae bacterium]|nr:MgtC/SapB family protein [Myxococcaceae bacterium]
MERFEPYPSLALALLVGLLIGLEREHSKKPSPEEKRGFTGGVRTYPIFALLGATSALMFEAVGPLPLFGATLGLIVFLGIGYWLDAAAGHVGLTSEASALLTFFLGALSTAHVLEPLNQRIFVVGTIAVAATFLLSAKTELRQFSARLSRDDVIATVKFLIIAVVMLPVLPNQAFGPYGVLNPYRIGFMVLLIAGIGFVGYVAMRLFGHGKGLLITGAIGGLASSTAVTLASAARAKQTPALAKVSALAVLIASTIMFVRVLITVAAVEASLLGRLAVPLGAMAAVSLVSVAVMALRDRSHRAETGEVELTNPFELGKAFQFGAFFVFILVVSRWATDTFGTAGTYLTGLLAGLTDVDAITLSMSNLVKSNGIESDVATRTIVIAVASNTAVKAGMAVVLGGWAFGRRIVEVSAATLVIGLALAVLL